MQLYIEISLAFSFVLVTFDATNAQILSLSHANKYQGREFSRFCFNQPLEKAITAACVESKRSKDFCLDTANNNVNFSFRLVVQ